MAHRQGLNDASANIHGSAVRLGRVLYGALAHAAVRNGEAVDPHADAGATCSFNQWASINGVDLLSGSWYTLDVMKQIDR